MKDQQKVFKSLTLISQFAIHMLVPIFMCSYLGYMADQKRGTSFMFILGFFIGAIAGGRNVFLLAKKIYDDGESSPSKLYEESNKKRKGKKKNGKGRE
ncbi:MAG: AtpZ/AtpI family protein [Lachnospiraceae bacterium]|nr:AtpZ/AtpI family protein [Lachnospiraceae bacterium]